MDGVPTMVLAAAYVHAMNAPNTGHQNFMIPALLDALILLLQQLLQPVQQQQALPLARQQQLLPLARLRSNGRRMVARSAPTSTPLQ